MIHLNNSKSGFTISKTLQKIILWGIVLGLSWLVNILLGPIQNFIGRLTPVAIFQLPAYVSKAIILTLFSSAFSWLISISVGIVFGIIAGMAFLNKEKQNKERKIWFSWVRHLKIIFEAFFVIPLVLTIGLTLTILFQLYNQGDIPRSAITIIIIVVSGIALAGQRVFIAVFDSVASASTDDHMLSSSLTLINNNKFIKLRRALNRITIFEYFNDLRLRAKILISCNIRMLAQALEQAFHLAVVGVVIAETVLPGLYEYIFQQSGASPKWVGGIGRVIIDGQNTVNPEIVAGAIWLILIIDGAIVWIIRGLLYRFNLKYYRTDQ